MHARVVLGVRKGVEVSSVQECPHRERGSTVQWWDDFKCEYFVLFSSGALAVDLEETGPSVPSLVCGEAEGELDCTDLSGDCESSAGIVCQGTYSIA